MGRNRQLTDAQRLLYQAIEEGRDSFPVFSRKIVGVRPHPGQLDVVQMAEEDPFLVLALPNSWGKTFFLALFLLWTTFYRKWAPPNWGIYKGIALAPQLKHAQRIHEQIENLRHNRHRAQFWCSHASCEKGQTCPEARWHKFLVADKLYPYKDESTHDNFRWKHNLSELWFKSAEGKAESIEGTDGNIYVYDEARRELYLDFLVNEVILPRGLRVPGMRMVLASTPLRDSFDFMELFQRGVRGEHNWRSRKGNIWENTSLNTQQIQEISDALDPRVRDQVLRGEFVAPPDAFFIQEAVLASVDEGPTPLDIDQFEGKAVRGHLYVAGADSAVSETGDESVVYVWDVTEVPFKVVFARALPRSSSIGTLLAYCEVLSREFNGCQVAYDANGPLGVEMKLQSKGYHFMVPVRWSGKVRLDEKPAKDNEVTMPKAEGLSIFRSLVNNHQFWSPNIKVLRAQMLSYQIKDDKLKTDHVMANVNAAIIARTYISATRGTGGMTLKAPVYQGQRGPFTQKQYENKTPLQRKVLMMAERRKAEREREEQLQKVQNE